MIVTGVRILVSSCVGLKGSHYSANTRHIRLFGAECRSMVISALYGAVPLAFRGFYEEFWWAGVLLLRFYALSSKAV